MIPCRDINSGCLFVSIRPRVRAHYISDKIFCLFDADGSIAFMLLLRGCGAPLNFVRRFVESFRRADVMARRRVTIAPLCCDGRRVSLVFAA